MELEQPTFSLIPPKRRPSSGCKTGRNTLRKDPLPGVKQGEYPRRRPSSGCKTVVYTPWEASSGCKTVVYMPPCCPRGYSTPCGIYTRRYPGGYSTPCGIYTLVGMVGILHPGIPLPYTPWVYHHPHQHRSSDQRVCCMRAVQDEEALGSNLGIIRQMRRIEASNLPKV